MAAKPQLVQCNTCKGVYRTLFDDGTAYFHACPPETVTKPASFDPVTLKQLTPEERAPLQNRRDENIRSVDENKQAVIKSDGAGVTTVTDAAQLAAFGLAQGGK